MIILLVLALYYIYIEFGTIRITASELVTAYSSEKVLADKKYLNKEIELSGNVAAFYEFTNEMSYLELDSENNSIGIYCLIGKEQDLENVRNLTRETRIKIIGVCMGMSDQKFPNSVYIKVIEIK